MNGRGADHPDRRSVALGLGAGLLALGPGGPANAQSSAGIEVLAAGAAGEGADQLARAIAEGFGRGRLTPRAVSVNVSRGMEGLASFAEGKRPRAPLMVVGLSTIGALVAENAFDKFEVCRPLTRLIGETMPIVVHADSKLKTAADLIAALKQDVSSVTLCGRARGSADHQLCLLLAAAAGVEPGAINYRAVDTSAQASFELLTRKVMVSTGAMLEFWPQIKGGMLRALAIASPERFPGVDVPTLREQQLDIALVNWRGVITRQSVGDTLVTRFGDALKKLVELPGWRQMLEQRFWTHIYQDDQDFGAFVDEETSRVRQLLEGLALR